MIISRRGRRIPVLLLAAAMLAQPRIASMQEKPAEALDPIVGTWTLDRSQSQFPIVTGVPRGKDQTESYQEANGRIELRLVRILEDGAQVVGRLTWSTGGGIVQVVEGPVSSGESYVETRLIAGDWLVTYLLDGRQYGTMRKTVSPDGRTMHQHFRGVVQGATIDVQQVFTRVR
jgi:hypothetical protein